MSPQSLKGEPARVYSQRLGPLSYDQFQAALDRFDLGQIVAAEAITTGNFGQNLFLTSTTGEYVLRGAPHWPWQFPMERFYTQLLHGRTLVPVPWPYLLDRGEDIFGWSYVIMPRMPGLQLSQPDVRQRLDAADRRGIATAMGKTLAHLHQLVWPYTGVYDLTIDSIRPFEMMWPEQVSSRVNDYLQMALSVSDRTTAADVAWVNETLEQAQAALATPFQPCFVMEDFKEGNVVAECDHGVWRISGVFDYMTGYFGDGEIDLARQVGDYANESLTLAQTFVGAYVEQQEAHGRPLRPGFRERFAVYMLLDRLILWQFGQRIGPWWEPTLTLREWASPYLSLDVF